MRHTSSSPPQIMVQILADCTYVSTYHTLLSEFLCYRQNRRVTKYEGYIFLASNINVEASDRSLQPSCEWLSFFPYTFGHWGSRLHDPFGRERISFSSAGFGRVAGHDVAMLGDFRGLTTPWAVASGYWLCGGFKSPVSLAPQRQKVDKSLPNKMSLLNWNIRFDDRLPRLWDPCGTFCSILSCTVKGHWPTQWQTTTKVINLQPQSTLNLGDRGLAHSEGSSYHSCARFTDYHCYGQPWLNEHSFCHVHTHQFEIFGHYKYMGLTECPWTLWDTVTPSHYFVAWSSLSHVLEKPFNINTHHLPTTAVTFIARYCDEPSSCSCHHLLARLHMPRARSIVEFE